jgi:seryl-tRNA synthetase
VLLQYALLGYAGQKLLARRFVPTVPPVLVREVAMYGTGFFPADKNEIYKVEEEDLFLVGTSEVPLAALHMDETVPGERLPLRYSGYSSCFRREAGAAGKDTRGIFRVHQFDKLEMFSFCHPDKSVAEHEVIREVEEEIIQGLGLHYRVVDIAASTLGAPAARKYDVEAWFPSQGRFRELTSCSNCTDFQARRLGARAKVDGKTVLLHTLNGTAVAIGRTLIAVMENHQLEDGRIRVPEALRPYLPGQPEVLGPESGVPR